MEKRSDRKLLVIRGARQVGKTWLLKEFGRIAFKETVYVNFDNNPQMKELFSADMRIERIITGLELYSGHKIELEDTLFIFDAIQEVPQALASLKYFREDAPQYQIVCAGSLLGIALHQGTSFPVGKVEFLDLYPFSHREFLMALGKNRFDTLLEDGDFELAITFRMEYMDLLKQYYYVGGMPEVVMSFVKKKDFNEVRKIQSDILDSYVQDFSKHAPNDRGSAEVDFVIDSGSQIIPLEVKAETNLKAKSLKVYVEKYKPSYLSGRPLPIIKKRIGC
ncbi:ATP-binding protein [uncultured Sphaerochaeta sp.]|uniref:ATP-binding protein n=1 Tax=uncultured Sphaerochaeta sp. TaxID=886478 RepID=UPI002A0A595C|nr:ATP-binding protein [uncultured Sphaerochaeta sp.]